MKTVIIFNRKPRLPKSPGYHLSVILQLIHEDCGTGLILSADVAAAENKVGPTGPLVVPFVVVSAPLLPFVVARSCCVVDDRCSYGSGGCWGWSKPSCRCYRSVPCWAWCERSVCAASTALRKSGFCCKAHIETHRLCCCRPTDLAAEPDTGLLLFLFTSRIFKHLQIDAFSQFFILSHHISSSY